MRTVILYLYNIIIVIIVVTSDDKKKKKNYPIKSDGGEGTGFLLSVANYAIFFHQNLNEQ